MELKSKTSRGPEIMCGKQALRSRCIGVYCFSVPKLAQTCGCRFGPLPGRSQLWPSLRKVTPTYIYHLYVVNGFLTVLQKTAGSSGSGLMFPGIKPTLRTSSPVAEPKDPSFLAIAVPWLRGRDATEDLAPNSCKDGVSVREPLLADSLGRHSCYQVYGAINIMVNFHMYSVKCKACQSIIFITQKNKTHLPFFAILERRKSWISAILRQARSLPALPVAIPVPWPQNCHRIRVKESCRRVQL